MDRLSRTLATCGLGLGLLMTATGCRSTRTAEVPPGRPIDSTGRQRKAIDFSTDGHPVSGEATTAFQPPQNMGGSNLAQGIGTNARKLNPSTYGAPNGAYGGPGTSGLGQPPSVNEPPGAPPADMAPPAGAPPFEANMPPARASEPAPAPNPIIQPPAESGTMGNPSQMPLPM